MQIGCLAPLTPMVIPGSQYSTNGLLPLDSYRGDHSVSTTTRLRRFIHRCNAALCIQFLTLQTELGQKLHLSSASFSSVMVFTRRSKVLTTSGYWVGVAMCMLHSLAHPLVLGTLRSHDGDAEVIKQ